LYLLLIPSVNNPGLVRTTPYHAVTSDTAIELPLAAEPRMPSYLLIIGFQVRETLTHIHGQVLSCIHHQCHQCLKLHLYICLASLNMSTCSLVTFGFFLSIQNCLASSSFSINPNSMGFAISSQFKEFFYCIYSMTGTVP